MREEKIRRQREMRGQKGGRREEGEEKKNRRKQSIFASMALFLKSRYHI